MNNDQLTELSAKAIGLRLIDAPADNGARIIHPDDGGGFWNPLQSGDDIVRLIASMPILIEEDSGRWFVLHKHTGFDVTIKWVPYEGHAAAMAALRLAVTQLAARIGKGMVE